ncbi:DUF2497 domain-containing protein [Novosphingobium aquimarinum]|uniref:DUF2497 domain-containing protein n=1 Tax=Novosphingobium aquimarinum TaxID=2682494 RepID=UPI0012EC197F|nr:DUF2497 domain-containing protein [Novosphingobium aquimarinum]
MRQAGEPTVEEILESIKKVIARDNRAGAAIERQRRADEGVREAPEREGRDDLVPDEDVLDLSAMRRFEEDEPVSEDVVEDDESGETGHLDHLVNATAQESMRESLAALAMLAKPGVPPQIVRSGETSLEGLVREMLKPALAEWLDKNLPPLVEKLVAAEIARIVGKKT